MNAQDTSAEPKPDLPLEIAHLLLIDVVGYSKLLVNEQIELLQDLNQIVRNTECFRAAETKGKLIRVPSGDVMALLFFHSPEEPVRCALEISRTLQEHPHIQLRMGVHSGPVNQVTDVNDKMNIAGSGINVAQRVMDCGDAGHILLSGHIAEDLTQYRDWQPYLHDLGECEVKHGLRLHLVNLYKDNLGNPHVPDKLKRRTRWKQTSDVSIRPVITPRWPKHVLTAVLLVSAVALAISFSVFYRRGSPAVVRSSVAKAVADQLRVKLTGEEERVIAAKPTDNPEAYDAYLRGLAYNVETTYTPANALAAQKYLREAVRLDPKFALSWALLSIADARGYITQTLQPTVALREEARQAAETALALQPNLGEALLATGNYYHACLKDYDTAVRYFEQARQFLPNSSQIPALLASVARRRGQWDRSESYFNQTERLDPRNVNLLGQHAQLYIELRRFPEALRKFDQVLDIMPGDVDTLAAKAAIAQAEGDLPLASALLAPLHPPAEDPQALETQVYQAILERRPGQIIPRLKEILAKPDPALGSTNGELRFWLGWAQEVAGDHAAAQESWQQARSELEPFLKEQSENSQLIDDLALTNMGLGDKTAAFKLIERAMTVISIEKDAVWGPIPIEILARVSARMGEPDRAIAALEKLLSIPYDGALAQNVPLTPALLRLDPMFDPLRNDPRFQKLAASPAPKDAKRWWAQVRDTEMIS